MINDNSKPLVLIGSNASLWLLKDMCEQHGIQIHGIIDDNYFGNTDSLEGIPVIDTECALEADPSKLEHYKQNYNFFLATNYVPSTTPALKTQLENNTEKLRRLRNFIDRFDLPCISLVDQSARVHPSCVIGKNVIVDAMCYFCANNHIEDYCSFFAGTMIGYHNVIQRGTVFQRRSGTMHYNTFGRDVYVGLHSQISGERLTIADGTIIHPCLCVRRSTKEGETISLAGRDLRKIYYFYTMEDDPNFPGQVDKE